MKTLKLSLLALFVAITSHLSAALAPGELDDLVQAIREDPDNTAALVEAIVAETPADVGQIVRRLLATFPDLADEVIFGAINGLPEPTEDQVAALVREAIAFRPALANAIVGGATRATPAWEDRIIASARLALRGTPGLLGRSGAPNGPETNFDSTLLIISPSS